MRNKNTAGWRKRTSTAKNSPRIRPWLIDRGSLTALLQMLGPFSVILLRQHVAKPTRDEAQALGLKHTQQVWIREVRLLCAKRPVVFAHTVLPRRPRGPLIRWLARLGNRSLGALLFSHPRFVRGELMARPLDRRHALFRPAVKALGLCAAPPPILWARRSRFSFGAQSLLVTEIFSPEIGEFPSTPKA